jgi:hypothetical protein
VSDTTAVPELVLGSSVREHHAGSRERQRDEFFSELFRAFAAIKGRISSGLFHFDGGCDRRYGSIDRLRRREFIVSLGDADSGNDTNAHANRFSDGNAYSRSDGDTDTEYFPNTYRCPNANACCSYTDAHAYPCTDADAFSHTYADPDTHANSHTDPNAYAYTDTRSDNHVDRRLAHAQSGRAADYQCDATGFR